MRAMQSVIRHWGYGATAARLTPAQKVGSSNLSVLILLSYSIGSCSTRSCEVSCRWYRFATNCAHCCPVRAERSQWLAVLPQLSGEGIGLMSHRSWARAPLGVWIAFSLGRRVCPAKPSDRAYLGFNGSRFHACFKFWIIPTCFHPNANHRATLLVFWSSVCQAT